MLKERFADLVQPPLVFLFHDRLIGRVDFFLRFDVEAVMVQHRHFFVCAVFLFDNGNRIVPAQTNKDRDRTGANNFETKELGIELAGLVEGL